MRRLSFESVRPDAETSNANRYIAGTMSVLSSLLGVSAAHAETAAPDQPAPNDNDTKLGQVVVTGIRPLLHDKLPEDVQNTPQSVTVVTDKLMVAQAATRLEDALKNVPGITLNAGEGAARGDTVNLRGFSAFNDFFLDGVRDAAIYTRDSFNLAAVEVVKGPSAILFGRGSTGGAINQVSKAPTLAPLESVTLNVGTNDLYRTTGDFNVPLSATSALRLNAMAESSAVADRDFVENRRFGIAPSLALGIGEADSLILAYLHQQENNIPDSGIPFVNGKPAPVPREAFYGLATDHVTTRDDIGTVRYKHIFDENFSVANTLRYAKYRFNYQDTLPNFGSTPPAPTTPLNTVLVGRDAPDSSGTQTNLTDQLDFTVHFATGSVAHTLVTGVEFARQTSDISRYTNPFNGNNNWIARTPLLSPDANETHPGEPVSSYQDTTAHSAAVYAVDTMAINKYLDVVAGFRYDRFSADYNQLTVSTGAVLQLDHVDKVSSPRAAIVVKPTLLQSYYLSYGTSFDPSAEALALTTKTANLGPVKAKTYEAGAKTGWLGGMLTVTGAIFRTEVDNAQTNDPDNPTITVLNGDQRVDGLELGASGYLTTHLEIFAGYTYLDAKTIASGTPLFVGKVIPNAARHALNLWTEYELTDAWELGAGGNWLGQRYADTGNTASAPGYVVWNAMASYRVTDQLSVQLNALNLFNKLYYENLYYTSPSENHIYPGAGRSANLTIRMNF